MTAEVEFAVDVEGVDQFLLPESLGLPVPELLKLQNQRQRARERKPAAGDRLDPLADLVPFEHVLQREALRPVTAVRNIFENAHSDDQVQRLPDDVPAGFEFLRQLRLPHWVPLCEFSGNDPVDDQLRDLPGHRHLSVAGFRIDCDHIEPFLELYFVLY